MKKVNEVKNNLKQGFTLLELLVVVLIIGILAGIALPQYQMAVGKARFSELKTITKNIQQAAQRYYMEHGTYDLAAKDLDIDLNITSGANSRSFGLQGGISCTIWKEGEQGLIACNKVILKRQMYFYISRSTGQPYMCFTYSKNKTDNANRLCQQETGKTASQAYCNDTNGTCQYMY